MKINGGNITDPFEEHVKKVREKMGMPIEEFHEKLEGLLTTEYLAKAADNFRFLKEWITDGRPIVTFRKEGRQELDLQDGEYFVPCFDPDKPVKNELPIFWFYSNKDNLVSVINRPETIGGRKVYWLIPKESGDNRGCQKWFHPVTGKTKTIKAYSLGTLIFNEQNVFGRAKEMLELFGSYAYGTLEDPYYVQGHHEESTADNLERIYDNQNIGTVDTYAHRLLDKIRMIHKKIREANSLSEKRELKDKAMKEVFETLNIESPDQGVIVWTGERYDLNRNFIDDKGSSGFRYLADKSSLFGDDQKEWYITPLFLPDTNDETKDWIRQMITTDQDRIAAKFSQMLRDQNMPYGTFAILPYTFEGRSVCNLMITRLRPAVDE